MYPDSVNRVRPPNTTIPNTLAALPRSQYATGFSLLLGKKRVFLFPFCPILLLKDDEDDDESVSEARLPEVAEDTRLALDLKALTYLGDASLKRSGRVATRGRRCEHWKNCLVSLGATCRNAGSKEVIVAVYSPVV